MPFARKKLKNLDITQAARFIYPQFKHVISVKTALQIKQLLSHLFKESILAQVSFCLLVSLWWIQNSSSGILHSSERPPQTADLISYLHQRDKNRR